MSILILALFAAAPTPQPGEVKTFKDWTVACDNIRFCTAELLDDEESSEAYNEISLTRSGIAGAPVAIDAAVDTTRGDAVLAVDGAVVQSLGTAKKSGVSGVLTLATLARMVQGDQIEIRVAGKVAVKGSLAGFSAAMRYWDAAQKRDGGPDAIVAKGRIVRSILPPAAPRIVVARFPLSKAAPPDDATIVMLAKRFGCGVVDPDLRTKAEAYKLGSQQSLILVPCEAGAYNFITVPVIATGKTYVHAPFDFDGNELTNADFDAETAGLGSYEKDRGMGDCGTSESWVWDGKRFRLTEVLQMSECRGSIDWMRTWTATVVR